MKPQPWPPRFAWDVHRDRTRPPGTEGNPVPLGCVTLLDPDDAACLGIDPDVELREGVILADEDGPWWEIQCGGVVCDHVVVRGRFEACLIPEPIKRVMMSCDANNMTPDQGDWSDWGCLRIGEIRDTLAGFGYTLPRGVIPLEACVPVESDRGRMVLVWENDD